MASRFKGASGARGSEKGTKLSDGTHVLKLTRIDYSEEGAHGEYYVAEFEVVESGNPADPKGASRTWTQAMAKTSYPLPKLNAFVFALMGYDTRNVADSAYVESQIRPGLDEIHDAMQDKSDPLGLLGRRVKVETRATTTKKGFAFVEHKFSPVVDQEKFVI